MQRRERWSLWFCLTLIVPAGRLDGADDKPEPSRAEVRATQRMEAMRGAIDAFQITSSDGDVESASRTRKELRFSERPLLRYQDQSRHTGEGVKGVLDASVWRLGERGRPKALVTLEIYLVDQKNPLLAYEFVSLTPQGFELESTRGHRWKPHGTDLSMATLDGAPLPGNTPRARLAQMRELARRFTALEEFQGEKIVCRLLPQPIDRYDDPAAGIEDGAVFVFANGTNPEIGLLLECSHEQWSYGAFRLAAATIAVQLDGKTFLESSTPPGEPVDGSYTGVREWIVLPE
jgi:hypothetical protein